MGEHLGSDDGGTSITEQPAPTLAEQWAGDSEASAGRWCAVGDELIWGPIQDAGGKIEP